MRPEEAGHRIYCDPDVFKPLPNALLRNNRDGTFTDVSEAAGLSLTSARGWAWPSPTTTATGGWTSSSPTTRRPTSSTATAPDGRFAEVAFDAGVSANESGAMVSGMGCDFKDFDNDGWPDIFLTDLVRTPSRSS